MEMEMDSNQIHNPNIAPVGVAFTSDVVSHSLAVLASVYNYNHWIFSSIRDFLGTTVLEVGAGVGNISQFLLNVDSLTCIEPFDPYCQYLKRRLAKHQNVRVLSIPIEDCPNGDAPEHSFDTIICLNVLEHIREDVAVLKIFHRLLKPGGHAIVLVPALPWLYGAMDREMGHVKRYTRKSLRTAFTAAGFQPCHSRYMNFVGTWAWWWRGRIQRKTMIPEKETRLFDRIVPFLSAMEQIVPPLFGQSVIVVGRA